MPVRQPVFDPPFSVVRASHVALDVRDVKRSRAFYVDCLGLLVTDETADALGRLGHEVNWWREWEWKAGCVCTVVKNERTGMLEGGADVRRPGGVRGW